MGKQSSNAPAPDRDSEYKHDKTCFIITPIGDGHSSIRRAADGLVDSVICPVLEKLGYRPEVAHRMSNAGSITKQVIQAVLNADMVVANVTGLNPNVMYELALRHAKRKAVVIVVDEGVTARLPFDFADQRAIFFVDDMKGAVDLRPKLEAAIQAAAAETEPDNPVYAAVQEYVLKEVKAPDDATAALAARLDRIEDVLVALAPARSRKMAAATNVVAPRRMVISLERFAKVQLDRQRLDFALVGHVAGNAQVLEITTVDPARVEYTKRALRSCGARDITDQELRDMEFVQAPRVTFG